MSVQPLGLARLGDERLARLVADDDERAFAALYERYHQPLYRYCRAIVRDDTDAQDALQATFAGAFVALRRAQRSAPVRPWLYRIAHNEAVSLLRLRCSGEELSEASVPSAEDQADDRERFGLLVADLRELPERLRGALLMRELSGLSHEEIATALDTSVGAAKQAIFDARKGLLEFAEGRAMACEAVRRSISDGDGRVLRGRRMRAHLRDCQMCAAFASAIPARRAELQALVPVLPAAASAAMLARVIGSGPGHTAGSAAGALAAGAAGKTIGATIAAKTLVGAAILATAAAGVTGVTVVLTHTHHKPAATHERTRRSSPVSARQATGTHALGTVRGSTTRGHTGASAGRAATSTSGVAAAGASTVPATQQSGVGARGTLPSQAQGTPAQSRGGRVTGPSKGVGRHPGGPPASLPRHVQPRGAGGSPASPPPRSQPSIPRGSRTSGARGSKSAAGGGGSTPTTTPAPPSTPAQSSTPTHSPSHRR